MSWPNPSVIAFTCNLYSAKVNSVSYRTGVTGLNGSDKKWKPFNENFLVPGPDPVSIFYRTCCLLLWATDFALIMPSEKCWQHNPPHLPKPKRDKTEKSSLRTCLSHTCSQASCSCSPLLGNTPKRVFTFLTVMPGGSQGHVYLEVCVPGMFPTESLCLLQRVMLAGQSHCTVPPKALPWGTAMLHHTKDLGLVGSLTFLSNLS